jgi:adenylate kinase
VQLVLLGAPGSGKGTQGIVLARRFGVRHVSSGELLRRQVAANSELGRAVGDYLARGELVPDELVMAVVGDALANAVKAGGYVLEGIPRTLAQAERAYAASGPAGPVASAVVYLDVPDGVVRARLARRAGEGRADDADAVVIERRLQVFHAETGPLLDFYRAKKLLLKVNGAQSPAAVSMAIVDALTA